MADKMDEMIIVVEREQLFCMDDIFAFQGIQIDPFEIDTILEDINSGMEIMRRGDAENDPKYKQPIPYVIIKRNDEVFLYERLKGGGESRLHNKTSIGVGGHMNAIEGLNFEEVLKENLLREVSEELILTSNDFDLEYIGLINDDSNEVGKVHLGIMAIAHIPSSTEVSVRETDQLLGKWISITDLKKHENYERLENWSKMAIDIL